MNKILLGGVAVAVLGAGGYAGATFYAGQRIDGAFERNAAELGKYPIIKIVKRDFQKGFLTSVENVTYRIGCETGLEGSMLDGATGTVTLRNTISHNPFAMSVKTEIVYDEKTRAELAKIFKGQDPLSIVTRISMNGDYQTDISSPAFVHSEAGTKVDWKGISASIKSNQAFSFVDSALKFGGLAVDNAENKEKFVLGELTYSANQVKSADGLYGGKGQMTLAGIEARSEGGEFGGKPFDFKTGKLELSSDTKVEGGFVNGTAKGGVAALTLNGKLLGDVSFDYALERIDAAAVKQINDMSINSMLQCKADPAKDMQVIQQALLAIVKKDPKFSQKFALKTAEGESQLAMHLSSKGVSDQDLSNIDTLLPKLDGGLNIQVPQALVERVIRETSAAEEADMMLAMFQEQLNQVVAQGFAQTDGKLIKSKFELKGGAMQLNGQPFDPRQLMGM